jgi:hypothetical protein
MMKGEHIYVTRCNCRRQKSDQERSREDSKIYKYLTIEIQHMWNVKTKVIPVVIVGKLNHLKIIQKILNNIPEKPRNQGTTENSHTGHFTHNSESNNIKVNIIQNGK